MRISLVSQIGTGTDPKHLGAAALPQKVGCIQALLALKNQEELPKRIPSSFWERGVGGRVEKVRCVRVPIEIHRKGRGSAQASVNPETPASLHRTPNCLLLHRNCTDYTLHYLRSSNVYHQEHPVLAQDGDI